MNNENSVYTSIFGRASIDNGDGRVGTQYMKADAGPVVGVFQNSGPFELPFSH